MKRLQVLFEETEYRRIVRLAKRQGITLAEWVRQTLRYAYRQEPLGDRDKKLAAVRTAVTHEFPTANIDQMLAEIAAGTAQRKSIDPHRFKHPHVPHWGGPST